MTDTPERRQEVAHLISPQDQAELWTGYSYTVADLRKALEGAADDSLVLIHERSVGIGYLDTHYHAVHAISLEPKGLKAFELCFRTNRTIRDEDGDMWLERVEKV